MTCNRCTEGFDHHCVFANNCIGTCNYRFFAKLIVYIEILVLINLVCCGLDLNLYIKDKEKFRQNVPVYKDPNAAISLICIDLILVIIVVLLNGYLIAFHIHIKRKKMTTYEFICRRTHRIVPNSDRNIQDKSRSYFNSIGFESVLSE